MQREIIPAILPYTIDELKNKLSLIDGLVNRVQVDIVGKAFSPETTIGVESLESIGFSCLLDLHLMVREPIAYLNRCDMATANRVFGQIEYMKNVDQFIEYAFALGMRVGLALDVETPVSRVEKVLANIDSLLLMSVKAGESGQVFKEVVFDKIKAVREMRDDVDICVDGGLNEENIVSCFEAGANEFAVGSYLWSAENIKNTIEQLKEEVK